LRRYTPSWAEKTFKEASPAVLDVPPKDVLPAGKFILINSPDSLELAGLKGK
jgi:hypothetical protein